MRPALAFLHTSAHHPPTFDALLKELGPDVTARHIVDEDLLRAARARGLDASVLERIEALIDEARAGGAAIVLCTCSTIGGAAEEAGRRGGVRVLRVDRPMAERAVALGRRVVVVAALESTLLPTRTLLQEAADRAGTTIEVIDACCPDAWERFERGDEAGYLRRVASHLRRVAAQGDVIVLAQASMAAAADLCPGLPVPVLSSPRLGLAAALAAFLDRRPGAE